MKQIHNIKPVYNSDSRVLILGSFPSVKSREAQFFYHHPQNRFWKVLSLSFQDSIPHSIDEKIEFLLKHHIALWDVIESCEIQGSSDSSIKNVKVNDLVKIINKTHIQHIYTNGKLSDKYFHCYFDGIIDLPVTCLPSTSPANAAYQIDRLYESWKTIAQD